MKSFYGSIFPTIGRNVTGLIRLYSRYSGKKGINNVDSREVFVDSSLEKSIPVSRRSVLGFVMHFLVAKSSRTVETNVIK